MLTISAKALGRKKPLFADWSIPLPPSLEGSPTLRDLISHVVRGEVAAFQDRQEERRLLKALSAREIAAGAAAGKIEMGGQELDQIVDPDEAVAVALQAFTDGMYLVVVEERELRELDEPIALQPSSRVTFIRMSMLAGG
jgi:hypothetical protein